MLLSRSRDQCAANWSWYTNFTCSLGLGFVDGRFGLSSGHLQLSGDGLGFWNEGQKSQVT